MKPRFKSMMWNIRKQKTTTQNNQKKKEYKIKEEYKINKQPVGQLQEVQHSHPRGARRRERARNWRST